jgi:hypothetical protein
MQIAYCIHRAFELKKRNVPAYLQTFYLQKQQRMESHRIIISPFKKITEHFGKEPKTPQDNFIFAKATLAHRKAVVASGKENVAFGKENATFVKENATSGKENATSGKENAAVGKENAAFPH